MFITAIRMVMVIVMVMVMKDMVRLELDIDLTPFRTLMPSRLLAGLALLAHKLPKFSKIPQDPSRCLQIENLGS